MAWKIEKVVDPRQRMIWLRAQGRADAELVIKRGAAGARETYKGQRELLPEERSAYLDAYRGRMHKDTLEQEAAGVQLVSPDYRGPLTETDWWRGITVTPPEETGQPVRRRRPE